MSRTLAVPTAPRPTVCLLRPHHCRLYPIRSPRPRNVRSRSDYEPDNDRANSPTTTPIDGLSCLSSGVSRYVDTTEPVDVMSVEDAPARLPEAERRRDEAVARMDELLAGMGYSRWTTELTGKTIGLVKVIPATYQERRP